MNRHEARKLIIKELDLRLNGEASKITTEEMKIKERARIKRKKSKAKYGKDKEENFENDKVEKFENGKENNTGNP